MSVVRPRAVLIVAAMAVVAAACKPVTHPIFTAREGPTSPVTVLLLSGNGNFVVAEATAASTMVPGPGTWRVDRRDGSVAALPGRSVSGGYDPVAISNDGMRVQLNDVNSHPVVWSHGVVLSSPSTLMALSPDLTFALLHDSAGVMKRWNVLTGAVTPVETSVPRPPGYTSAFPDAISDDGNVATFELRQPNVANFIQRIVDVPAHRATDLHMTDFSDTIELSADGSAFAHHHVEQYVDESQFPPVVIKLADWVELVDRVTQTVRRHYTVPDDRGVTLLTISDNGTTVWVSQDLFDIEGSACGPVPVTTSCVVASEAVVIASFGSRSFSTGSGDGYGSSPSDNGRFFVSNRVPLGPSSSGGARVVDWITGNVETLSQGLAYRSNDDQTCGSVGSSAPCTVPTWASGAQISTDGRTVVSTSSSGHGWYEYTPAPAPRPATVTSRLVSER